MGNFTNFGGLNLPNWGMGYTPPAPQPAPANTNKLYVVDADDALRRMAPRNTIVLYVQQDETMIHEVYTDEQGAKQIRSRALEPLPSQEPAGNGAVTRQEFDELKAAVDALRGGAHAE